MEQLQNAFRVISDVEIKPYLTNIGLVDINKPNIREWFFSIYHFDYEYIKEISLLTQSTYQHYVDTDKRHVITLTNENVFISFKEYETIRLPNGSYKFFICQLFVDYKANGTNLLNYLEHVEEIQDNN